MQTVDFNKDWVKSVTKEEFIEHEKHHALYVNLSDEYDKIVPPKKEKTEETK